MKKKLILSLAAVAALVAGVVGLGAFEAHIINVTAHIENALTVPVEAEGLSFGTVFPEEVAYKTFDMRLSDSFMSEGRVDDVEYVLRQKPKCGVPILNNTNGNGTHPVQYSEYVPVTEDAQGNFVCPMVTIDIPGDGTQEVQSVMLPLLCPYLSKTELDKAGATTTNAIPAFHGPLTNWTMADTLATQLRGRLSKADEKTSTSWLLDLHAPCFKGQCAQDNVIPAAYQYDPKFEGQLFGCDIWIEVTNISTSTTTPTLTVTKVVDNTGGGTKNVSDFPLFVDGSPVTSGVATTQTAGNHTVTETTDPNYTSVFSGDCNSGGIVNVPASGSANCTITNTFIPPEQFLIVHKVVITHVEGTVTTAADFQMTVDGGNVAQDVPNAVTPGNHTVGEVVSPNYTETFSAECPGGIANVPAGATVTCTVTNEQKFATLTLNKVVNNIHGGNNVDADFNLFASGSDATTQLVNGVPKNVAVGSLFINEQGVIGYQAAFTGDCDTSGQITLAEGENKQCTITNTDLIPNITLIKAVDSGTASPFSFALRLDGNVVTQGSSVGVTSNSAHTINEDAHTGYHFVSITGDVKCPSVLGGTATLNEGEAISCTIHNAINTP